MGSRPWDAPPGRADAAARRPVLTPPRPSGLLPAGGLLGMQRAAGNAAVATLLAPSQGKAAGAPAGVARYSSTRLTDRLRDMMSRGVLGVAGAPATLDRDQLFLLQGVAEVETGGMDNAVYTKDDMYLSLGFKQVTLGWGSLYEIMRAAPAAFAEHGIVLGSGTYTLKGERRPAIEGAPDPVVLKTPPWTDRFFEAGNEDAVVSAMVAFTLRELGRLERRLAKDSPGRSNPWMQDPTARAWLLETMNNRPVCAYAAAKGTLARTSGRELSRDEFLAVLESEILAAYEARGERTKGSHIIAKIPRSGPSGLAPQRKAAAPAAAAGSGAALAEKVAAVLPSQARPVAGGAAVLQLVDTMGLLRPALRRLAAGGHADTSALTDIAFWSAHPDLFGRHLEPSQSGYAGLSAEWVRLRDGIVRESAAGGARTKAATPAAQPPAGQVPASQIAPRAATDDRYFTQDVGHYQDVEDSGPTAGRTRLWLYGSSGANVCNMTSLTMALVSMAGEAEVRTRMIALLRSGGLHVGASVQVGGVFVALAEALDDPRTVARVETVDLITAVAIGPHGSYGTVTEAATIARIAAAAGLATAEVPAGPVHLSDPRVRARAARMLATGTRVIAGTVNHYVYLVAVRDDGVVVDDPAGARVTPGLGGRIFLHNGDVGRIGREFLAMDATRQEIAVRRVATNPAAAEVVGRLAALAAAPRAEAAATIRTLAASHAGHVSTGALNFYATSEFVANDLRLRVTLSSRTG